MGGGGGSSVIYFSPPILLKNVVLRIKPWTKDFPTVNKNIKQAFNHIIAFLTLGVL